MIPKEILKKVRRIEISTRGLVNDLFSGQYHSVFKGRGMNFSEVREYQYGDDIRAIDWNVTARMRHPYVKVFEEERELTVMLVVDASGSGEFGTSGQMKGEILAEICALLSFSAIKNNDKVGLIIFTDQIEKFVQPRKGRSHVLRVIRELLYFRPQHRRTDVSEALNYLSRVQRRRSVVFLASDFQSPDFESALRVTARRHDLISLTIDDPREKTLPAIGFIEFEDAETGDRLLLDTSDPGVRERFAQSALQRKTRLRGLFGSVGVDFVEISTETPYVDPLIQFFRRRARRIH